MASTASDYSAVEYVFEPHKSSMPPLRPYLEALWARRKFIAALVESERRMARSRTALGNIWSIINPLFQAGVYYFLYTVLRSNSANAAFLPILIANFFFFGLSLSALGEGGRSIRRAKGLMLNSTFPRALLPITSVAKSLREFVMAAAVLAVLFPLVGGTFGPGLFVLPLLFALQIVMNVGIAMLVSTYTVLVPDGDNVVNYITRILFFVTPVVYPVTLLPASAKMLISWQPLFPLFAAYQAVFAGDVPSPLLVFETFLWATALLVLGARVFLRREREFTIHL
jgi:teichoic acid transport system permease protein